MGRLRELDFLRGIAIILVLFRHEYLFTWTVNMGWIGVDLFFVLSGFLVSGLLFKEYLKFGTTQPVRFLIRRGFKIYPIYYLSYIFYLLLIVFDHKLDIRCVIADLLFLQNYYRGWGYAYAASWSLAVEEHFYFGFAIFLWLGLKYRAIKLEKSSDTSSGISRFEVFMLLTMVTCLLLRLYSNVVSPEKFSLNFTRTHLRIDSLLAGVFISYFYYFKTNRLTTLFNAHRKVFYAIAILGLIWAPFINPQFSFFVKTFGFLFLYTSFGILLIHFLLTANINEQLNRIFTSSIVNIVSKIGYSSYSIYIIHSIVNKITEKVVRTNNLPVSATLIFLFTSVVSITIGMYMTYNIESHFLKIRDKYFPSRVA